MFKLLQKLLLIAALCAPWAMQAQVSCDSGDPDTVTNLPAGSTANTTSSYLPAYSTYNYSYSEVIIPSSQLEDAGITEIKELLYMPTSTTSNTYFTNCTIYLANTTATNLTSGFTNSSDFEQVFAGSLNFTQANVWKSVEFDDSFTWDGSSNIVIAVKRDHGSWSSSCSFKAFSASTQLGRYVYNDNAPYTMGSVTGGTATSTVVQYLLVGCAGGDPVTCNRVRNLTASDILSDGVTLTWLDTSNTGATYTIYNMADTSVIVTGLNTNTYTVTGLNPNTNYTLAVVADCGGGDVSNYAKITFRTACAGLSSLPYFYGFEDAATGTTATFPSCWARINDATGSYNYYPYVYSTNHHSGNNSLYWYITTSSGYADNEYAILPPVDPTVYDVADLTLSFWAASTSASYHPVFYVGVMSDPTDASTFTPVDTISGIINIWTPYAVNFASYTGTGTYVAIKASRGSEYWYAVIDDITLIESSDFCAPPTNISSTVTTTSIELSWDGPSADSYLIYTSTDDTLTVTGTTNTFNDLNPNTEYEFLIAHICNDTSDFVYYSVYTACEVIDTLPYVMNFNNAISGSTYKFDQCWDIYNNYSTSSMYPYVSSGYLYTYLYSSSGANSLFAYAMLPELSDDLANTDMELSFQLWGSSTASYGRGVIVAVFDSVVAGMPTFDTVDIIIPTATSQSAAETYYVPIAGRDLTGKRIGFLMQNQQNSSPNYYYSYLDNVNLHELPNCPIPSNLTANAAQADSVIIAWNDTVASSWEVAIGGLGFNPDTVTELITVSDTTLVLDELVGGISYEAYVRANCGGDYSIWLGPVAFTPGSINMGVTGSATMYVCNAVIYDDGGAAGQYSNYCDYTLTLYPNDDTKRFKFWGNGSAESGYDYLRIYAGTAATGNSLAQIAADNVTIDTVHTQGGPITLYFHSDGSGIRDGFVLYVACEDLPSCRDIDNVTVLEVSTSSVYVTWENVIGSTPLPSSYIVNVIDSTQTVVSTTTTSDMFAILGGLDAYTDYTVTVVPSCDDGNGQPASTAFTTAAFGCLVYDNSGVGVPLQIGDGTGTSYYLPIGNFYNYSYTQQIFDASEFNGAMPITGIDFEYAYTSSTTSKTNVSIYLANVAENSLANGFIPYNASTFKLVYTGNLNATNGWNHYAFDSVFYYDGTSNLLVVIHDNSGSYNGSSYVFRTHNTAGGKGRYVQNDSAPYTISSITGGTSLAYRANTKFHTYACDQEASCAAPLFVVTNITDHSADLMWAAGASETSWTVQHKEISDASWTTDLANTSNTSTTVSGLQANTQYQFRVFHICRSDTFAVTRTIRTACLGAQVPFFEDFSSWSTGSSAAVPSCWFKGSDYSAGYPYVTTGNSMPGDNNSMYYYASGTTFTYLALPKFDAPLDTLAVSGYIKYSSNGYPIQIGYMTDPEDATTFHAVGTATTVANTWVPFEVTFNGIPDGYIALGVGNNGSYAYLYLDNIEVNYFNPCVRPTNVTSSNVTTNSASISWVDTAATEFEVEYGPAGFQHGQGTLLSVSSSNNVSLSNLNHSAVYDVYVRGICGQGDTGAWSFVHQLTTQCHAIDYFPFTENFEYWGTGSSVHAPMCWTYGSDYSTSYPYISTNTTHGGCMYMYDGSSAGSTNKTWFALPEIDSTVASVNQTQMLFSVYSSTTSYEHPVMVGVGNNSALDASVVWIDTIIPTYGQWTEHEVYFDSYTGNGHYIFFATHVGGNYAYSYPYIDDINLELIPSCPRPNNLYATNATYNSVDLGWNERGNATNWIIEYGPVGFQLGTGTIVAANSNPFTLTNMPSSYQGEFYVRSVCSSTDTGDYCRTPFAFATTQTPASIPYYYNFEDPAEWANWQLSSNSETNTWWRGTAVADSGNYSMYMSADSGVTYRPYDYNAVVNAAAFRDVDFGSVDTSFTISFRARVGGTISAAYDGLMVFLVDPAIATVPSNSNITSPWGNVNDLYRIISIRRDTTWQTYTASFDTIHGVYRVAFFWFNQNTGASYPNLIEPAAVDNIRIDYSACPRPLALQATPSSTTANLTWYGPSSANYQIIYRPYPNGTTNTFVNSTTNSYTLTGLEPMTQYVVWVRKICGGDTSLTCDGITFTTEMCDNAQWFMNYDSTMTTSTSTYSPIGYSFYNYGYVQNIIDSAYLADLTGDLTALAFEPTVTTAGSYYDNMTVYLANVPEDNLSSGWILPDDSIHVFQKVIDNASFSYTSTGIQLHGFDTSFTWDGHSNILVSVVRNHGSYSSGATFAAHNHGAVKSRYVYRDSPGPYNYLSPDAAGTALTTCGDIYLISCGGSHCTKPVAMSASDITYHSATVNWASASTDFEVAVKAANDATWPAETAVSNTTSFAVDNLAPATQYQFRVRAICDATEGLISDWTEGTFVTDSLPCFAPTDLHTTAIGYTTATLAWTADASQNQWSIRVWTPANGTDFEVTSNPFIVTGLAAQTTYYAAIKAVCGGGYTESEYSDTIEFTTETCAQVTGVTVSQITANSAVVTWNAVSAVKYEIEYGDRNFNQGTGTTIVVNDGTSYTLTGLLPDYDYSVFVRAFCEENVDGAWSDQVDFTTPQQGGGQGVLTVDGTANISIYPNPTSDATTIAVSGVNGEVEITIVDMNGRTVATETMSCEGDCTKRMEVSTLAQGAYFVRINGDSINMVKKLIVK